jgi:hypothetical protein
MESEYKYIDIVFENCICIRLLPEDVHSFYIGKITNGLWSNGDQYSKSKEAEFVRISLYYSAFERQTDQSHPPDETDGLEYHLNNYHDITHLGIYDLENNEEYIGVPWGDLDEKNPFVNPWEKVEYEKEYFTITIKEIM